MDYSNQTKTELWKICEEKGLTKYKSKNKTELVQLIMENTSTSSGDNSRDVQPGHTHFHLKPLIKWSGGKSDEIKMFEKYFPEKYDMYLEPFIGGGSVFFYIQPSKAVISDVHTELVDFYRSIGKGKGADIFDFMEKTPNDEETYYNVRDKMEIHDELDSAKRFYYQRKTCFRGMLRYNKSGKFIGSISKVIFKLLNKLYQSFLDGISNPAGAIFLELFTT
jgi:hypothetical protein